MHLISCVLSCRPIEPSLVDTSLLTYVRKAILNVLMDVFNLPCLGASSLELLRVARGLLHVANFLTVL